LTHQLDIHNRWPSPRNRDIRSLQHWLCNEDFGDNFLVGRPENVWDEEKGLGEDDYVGVANTADDISNFLASQLLTCTQILEKLRPTNSSSAEAKVRSLQGTAYQRLVNCVVTVVASALLILPIAILYVVKNMAARLGLIFAFTVVLSIFLSFGMTMSAEKVIIIATG
jgi:lipopolysaccharide export LptBFGC system permease protein LptF